MKRIYTNFVNVPILQNVHILKQKQANLHIFYTNLQNTILFYTKIFKTIIRNYIHFTELVQIATDYRNFNLKKLFTTHICSIWRKIKSIKFM